MDPLVNRRLTQDSILQEYLQLHLLLSMGRRIIYILLWCLWIKWYQIFRFTSFRRKLLSGWWHISNWCSNRSSELLNSLKTMTLSASTVQCNASQSGGNPFESHLDCLILSLSLFFLLVIQFWNSTMKKHSAIVSPTTMQLLCKL
jgi:hypothetical protein